MRDELLLSTKKTALKASKKALGVANDVAKMMRHDDCIHVREMKRCSRNGITLGLVGLGALTGAIVCFVKARDAIQGYQNWLAMDRKLDEALSESLDASDSVAKY